MPGAFCATMGALAAFLTPAGHHPLVVVRPVGRVGTRPGPARDAASRRPAGDEHPGHKGPADGRPAVPDHGRRLHRGPDRRAPEWRLPRLLRPLPRRPRHDYQDRRVRGPGQPRRPRRVHRRGPGRFAGHRADDGGPGERQDDPAAAGLGQGPLRRRAGRRGRDRGSLPGRGRDRTGRRGLRPAPGRDRLRRCPGRRGGAVRGRRHERGGELRRRGRAQVRPVRRLRGRGQPHLPQPAGRPGADGVTGGRGGVGRGRPAARPGSRTRARRARARTWPRCSPSTPPRCG